MSRIIVGADELWSGQVTRLQGKRVALLANETAVDQKLRPVSLYLSEHCQLVRLLAPEHGYWGVAQDMVAVDNDTDVLTGCPVISLYGEDESSLTPAEESLAGIDIVVFDIQDVGSRYYTYIWTMALTMTVCAKLEVGFVVLDRPNPLGGAVIEGPLIEHGFESFVGLHSVSNRHGMTAGEIAVMVRSLLRLDLELDVIECKGWQPSGLTPIQSWIAPSPNMPTWQTALVYPGMCLLEATEVSEGRGTTRPFEWIGAPYIEPVALARMLNQLGLPGCEFRPTFFQPGFQKHAGDVCGGIQVHVNNVDTFLPFASGVAVIWAIRRLWEDEFQWRHAPYEFVADIPAFDLLTGSTMIREGIESDAAFEDIARLWPEQQALFQELRQEWLIYER